MLLPLASGALLLAGFGVELVGLGGIATMLFWGALLAGGYTFVPGALRRLFRDRKLGIGLLMTISAVGAVILGFLEEAAALAFLYSIAEALEDRAMGQARAGLRSLLELVPAQATVLRAGQQLVVNAESIGIGQHILVKPGERVPTDGIVRRGQSSLDTSAITGESIPRYVRPEEQVTAGAINIDAALVIQATASGAENSLTTLVQLVEQAQAQRGRRARLADRIAAPLVPGVIILALAVGIVGSLLGDPETWVTRALVVLVAASPCALAIGVPVTVVSAVGAASRFGVIIKSGAAFERLGGIRHVAVDKTGTLTKNQPSVVTVIPAPGNTPEEVLAVASAVEQHSTHPLAQAIVTASPQPTAATGVREYPGRGLEAALGGSLVQVGNPRWLASTELAGERERLERAGITAVVVHRDGALLGLIGVRDELRVEAADFVAELQAMGIEVSMLTGDNVHTAAALAQQAGIREVHAALTPAAKARIVQDRQAGRSTAMIGDGINDAPALAAADVGIAMGVPGSDAAIETADVAFTGSDLRLIPKALAHARRGRRIINQNLTLAILIIVVLLPLAVSGVLGLAAVVLVHELAEVAIILNGLRAARR